MAERKQKERQRPQPGEDGWSQPWKGLQPQSPPTASGAQSQKEWLCRAEQRIKKDLFLSLLSLAELMQLRTKEYPCWSLDGLTSIRLQTEATPKSAAEI